MKRNIFAAILLLAVLAYSCTTKEEPFQEDPASSLSDIALIDDGSIVYEPAVIVDDFILDDEADPETKTVLTIDGSGAHFTFTTGDRIGVFPYTVSDAPQMPFTLKSSNASSCYFNCPGFSLKSGVRYAAYYPYDPTDRLSYTAVPVNYTGQTQTTAKAPGASDASFNISGADYLLAQAAPASGACQFKMSHIGALMVIDLTVLDTGTYTELSICSDNASFVTSGYLNVGQTYTAGTSSSPTQGIALTNTTTSKKVSLTLGSGGGISLTAGQTYRFCMMVYPIDLSGSLVTFKLKDSAGKYHHAITPSMTKNFRQGYAYRVSAAIAKTNLSTTNGTDTGTTMTANCYIVDTDDINAAGYKFFCAWAGNGSAAYSTRAYSFSSPHNFTGANQAYPAGGGVNLQKGKNVGIKLNQNSCVISGSTYYEFIETVGDLNKGYIHFKASGSKGNAMLLLTDYAEDDPMWNWHIWCTDKPGTVTYNTGARTYTVMDRNVGAITRVFNNPTSSSNNVDDVCGLYYQFGNPVGYTWSEFSASSATGYTMYYGLAQAPKYRTPYLSTGGTYWWFNPSAAVNSSQLYGILWGGGSNGNSTIQSGTDAHKTLYDPCPPGYKVTPKDFYDGIVNSNGGDQYGWYLTGTNGTLYFPYNGAAWQDGNFYMSRGFVPNGDTAHYTTMWTSGHNNSNMAYFFYIYAKDVNRAGGGTEGDHILSRGMGVRCVYCGY